MAAAHPYLNKKAGNGPTPTDRCAVNLLEHLIFDHRLMINFWCFYSPKPLLKTAVFIFRA